MRKFQLLFIALCLVCITTGAQNNSKESSFILDDNQLENFEPIKLISLPELIKKTVASKYPNFVTLKAIKGLVKGKVFYRIKLENDKVEVMIVINAEGRIVHVDKNNKYQN